MNGVLVLFLCVCVCEREYVLLLGLVPSGFTACGHLGVGLVTTATTRTISYFLVGSFHRGVEGSRVERWRMEGCRAEW